jgi:hypothetical protein
VFSFTVRLLYSRRKSPGTHWIGGWVDPRAGLDAVAKREIPLSLKCFNLYHQAEEKHEIMIIFLCTVSPTFTSSDITSRFFTISMLLFYNI